MVIDTNMSGLKHSNSLATCRYIAIAIAIATAMHACAYRYHRVVEDPWDDVGTMEAYMKLVVEQQTPLTYRSFVSQHGADNR
jgi:hypothetical protein